VRKEKEHGIDTKTTRKGNGGKVRKQSRLKEEKLGASKNHLKDFLTGERGGAKVHRAPVVNRFGKTKRWEIEEMGLGERTGKKPGELIGGLWRGAGTTRWV